MRIKNDGGNGLIRASWGLRLLAVCGLLCWGLTAFAGQSGDYTYSLSNDTVTITKYTGTDSRVVLPGEIEGNPVVAIGLQAFSGNTNLCETIIPEGLAVIGMNAFAQCSSLTNISLAESVTNIGNGAFASCYKLAEIRLGSRVQAINGYSFFNCSGLTNIWVDPRNAWYSAEAGVLFNSDKTRLVYYPSGKPDREFIVPDGVTSIDGYAFYICTNLAEITLPNGLTNIAQNNFVEYSELTSVELPDSVVSLGDYNFGWCYKMETVVLSTNLPSLPFASFIFCSQLREIYMPDSVTNVDVEAFSYCSNLANVYFSTNLSMIQNGFHNDVQLRRVDLPASLKSLSPYAFTGCSSLANIGVDAQNPVMYSEDGVVFNKDMSQIVKFPPGRSGEYRLPDSVTQIGGGVFSSIDALQSLTVGPNVTNISGQAFSFEKSLANILVEPGNPNYRSDDGILFDISGQSLVRFPGARGGSYVMPNSVLQVGTNALSGNQGLTNVVLSRHVTNICQLAFASCSQLRTAYLSPYLKRIESMAFDGCESLEGLYFKTFSPPQLPTRDFPGTHTIPINQQLVIYAPADGTGFGTKWSGLPVQTWEYPSKISCSQISDTSLAITNSYLEIKNVTVPATVDGLTVVSVGDKAFYGRQSLTNVVLPDTITNIGEKAFGNCSALTNVVLPNNLSSLGTSAFYYCSKLGQVTLPDTLLEIAPKAFCECYSLTNVTLPANLVAIGSEAFSGCFSLPNILFPASLASMGDQAFYECWELSQMFFRGDAPAQWGADVVKLFYGRNLPAIYRLSSATGWSQPFNGLDVLFWSENNSYLHQVLDDGGAKITGYSGSDVSLEIPPLLDGHPVEQIGTYVFRGILTLNRVVLPDSVTQIGFGAFSTCSNMVSVEFGTNLAELYEYAFSGCSQLAELKFPKSLTTIRRNAFDNCAALTRLVFDGNAPSLGRDNVSGYFAGSTNITVYYYDDTTGWGETFGGLPTVKLHRQTPFEQWAAAHNLAAQFPEACGEQDDPDHDGLTNLQEMNAGTNPADAKSALAFEAVARVEDLAAEDQTPVAEGQIAFYFQSVPGKTYRMERCDQLGSEWGEAAVMTATASQKRVVLDRPAGSSFYRVRVQP